jgi:CHAT domain-containing protein
MLSQTRFRDQPLELLTLSACETAAGDERAALGLSGLAVRAGARSVLGTLWKVNDVAASKIMVAFYGELSQPGTSRAVALQRAQMELLKDRRYLHPGYWSPFLIISNWL